MTYDAKYLDELSTAVGRVVIEWNRVELYMLGIVLRLAYRLNPLAFADDPHQVIYMAAINMEVKQKIATARAYAVLCHLPKDTEAELFRLLDLVGGRLRERRNLYVHASWHCDDGQPTLVQSGTQVVRPQARTREVRLERLTPFATIDEAAEFGRELTEVCHQLSRVDGLLC